MTGSQGNVVLKFTTVLMITAAVSVAADGPAPNQVQQQRVLDNVRSYAARYLETLPNFVCARVTEQYEAGKKPKKWKQGDTLTARLVFNQGQENETLELVNGKPIRPDHFVERPLETEGEFGTLVSKVLEEQSAAQITWSRWEELNGRRLAVFDYVVDAQHSTLSVGLDGSDTMVPYRGSIFADPSTGELWRVTSSPFDMPEVLQTKSVTTTIDYGLIDIGNRHFVLPVSASILLDTGKKNIWNKVAFTGYRKFEAESKVTFLTGPN
jgi:hypothetical protein